MLASISSAPASVPISSLTFLPPPPPPPPLPTIDSSLKVATLNVGCGFLRKLNSIITTCYNQSIAILAVQEIGDPALFRGAASSSLFSPYFFIYSGGTSNHEGGVGLLITSQLAPRCRSFKRSSCGRLAGVVLELSKGKQTLVVSAYMPSGLDHIADDDKRRQQATLLYNEIIQWSVNMNQVILMGDLNETLTQFDRSPSSLTPSQLFRDKPIHCLQHELFTDVYRHLFPTPSLTPGFTHFVSSASKTVQSRLDYIWTKGFNPLTALADVKIDNSHLRSLTHHRLLTATILIPMTAADIPLHVVTAPLGPVCRVALPNLRAASDKQKDKMTKQLEDKINKSHPTACSLLDATNNTATINAAAVLLTELTLSAATHCLPLTGAAKLESKKLLTLKRQRQTLTQLLRLSLSLAARPRHVSSTDYRKWNKLNNRCLNIYQLQWKSNFWSETDDWLKETQVHISSTRCVTRAEQKEMLTADGRNYKSASQNNPAAAVHKMLESDAFPSQLFAVVDKNNHLTTSAEELEDVMVDHFTSVFTVPPDEPLPANVPNPLSPPPILFRKSGIQSSWYSSLMTPVTDQELLDVLQHVKLIAAPGLDKVSAGIWKIILQASPAVRLYVCSLFSACLCNSSFPSCWKMGVILPFIKDEKKDRTMNNIRPITLQSSLGKLLNKILAHRLGKIFSKYPILNSSQRGFIQGGCTAKCIDELLDAWDWSREGQQSLYTLLYDIKQAYDSVQTSVLLRSLRRLHLPESFISLIKDSLQDVQSCIRTMYGETRAFPVNRSLRQGDPLAPLLFVILLDALHDGLEVNPFTGTQEGLLLTPRSRAGRINSIYSLVRLPSLGYADDTGILTNSLASLSIQHRWVLYFMHFNKLRLNANKCELVGRDSSGNAMTVADSTAHNISVDGHVLVPLEHSQSIKYLGLNICFDGSWKQQQTKSLQMIQVFTRAVHRFSVPVGQAVYMFNVFLLPKLELALHYVHGKETTKWLKMCDRLIIGCIKHCVSSPLRLSHTAVALTVQLCLPSWLETCVKISELFIRLNSLDNRWSNLGRMRMRSEWGSTVDSDMALRRLDAATRVARTCSMAVQKLRWSMNLREDQRKTLRSKHLFDIRPIDGTPAVSRLSTHALRRINLPVGKLQLAHDVWSGFGGNIPVKTYTRILTDHISRTLFITTVLLPGQ